MDVNVFRFVRRPLNPATTGPTGDYYDGVCTPADMKNLPIGNPLTGGSLYRSAVLDATWSNAATAETSYQTVLSDVQNLCRLLDVASAVGVGKVVTVNAGGAS